MIKPALSSCAAALLICAALLAPRQAGAESPAPGGSSGGTLNGYTWMDSDNANKLSFLLGVECGLAMEMALGQEQAKVTGAPAALSPFQRGWTAAFDNTPRQAIVDRLDAFYTAHPSQKDRHVFDVLWKEMLVPALPARS
ncbi:MAG: hypothetical protein J1E80_05440 [Desulfovibrionaceae bacterium]|nr:hypothetical protein [Desulfovibrionaceae bacterium]